MGAKTLTMLQAVLIAGIFEFVGAVVLGRVSTSTIAGKDPLSAGRTRFHAGPHAQPSHFLTPPPPPFRSLLSW